MTRQDNRWGRFLCVAGANPFLKFKRTKFRNGLQHKGTVPVCTGPSVLSRGAGAVAGLYYEANGNWLTRGLMGYKIFDEKPIETALKNKKACCLSVTSVGV